MVHCWYKLFSFLHINLEQCWPVKWLMNWTVFFTVFYGFWFNTPCKDRRNKKEQWMSHFRNKLPFYLRKLIKMSIAITQKTPTRTYSRTWTSNTNEGKIAGTGKHRVGWPCDSFMTRVLSTWNGNIWLQSDFLKVTMHHLNTEVGELSDSNLFKHMLPICISTFCARFQKEWCLRSYASQVPISVKYHML